MTIQQIQKKLENMQGRSFNYASAIHVVRSFIINVTEQKFTLNTDKNSFVRKLESAPEFFKYWFETKENLAVDKVNGVLKTEDDHKNLPAVFDKENTLADELVEILKDNIAKVKINPGYIKQAQAINNNVNAILHVQKLKLDMMKQLKNHKSPKSTSE